MRKDVLLRINALLGALSVALAGCHVQKKAAVPQPGEEEKTPASPVEIIEEEQEVRVLYGVPVDVYREEEPDTTIIMVKYGAPNPRR